MKHKAPVSYDDWRRIYQAEISGMGFAAHTYFRCKFNPSMSMPEFLRTQMARSMWRHTHRLNRIHQQLDECRERNDPTYLAAIAEYVLGTDDNNGEAE